ncbi:3-phosphoserine/phosphohydroxythreonine transaminase [Advenella sp. EE-W14]|uniref:3-phosphoserine/phosphohydroxythreonine transaminase n=1 Tax=Advenella sp. EE-W14 TaxID=2722705 RepID=UPI00145EFF4E|nr:3-phosphoserine/phosphohydroxythreonine transaminase [Advenella sp. EE-W14]
MNKQYWNFSAGPSKLPREVLQQAAEEMLDWHGSGQSVMEMSHRGPEFTQICDEAEADLRTLMDIPEDYAVMFMQGGATAENAILPMNLIARNVSHSADYVLTGIWSAKSYKEATRYGTVRIAAQSHQAREINGHEYAPWTWVPTFDEWKVNSDSSYLHFCSNETIGGVEIGALPNMDALGAGSVPLVVDASSHFLSRPLDIRKTGMVYAGAQKNAGPAGVTVVVLHRDLLGHALPYCPSAFDYVNVARERSRFNTPPTYAIYIAGLVFKWLLAKGGLAAIESENINKAKVLYSQLDSSDFYRNPIQPEYRSRMNVPFTLRDDGLNAAFLEGAQKEHLLNLKGHKSVGGMRASIYNAMPIEGVLALVDYLKEFERKHG